MIIVVITFPLLISQRVWAAPILPQEWEQANVIYLGERHDALQDHQTEQSLITALYERSPQLAIGLEMFQRPFQPVLDQFLRGEIDESLLQSESEFAVRWGFDWDYYAPILRFAKEHHVPLAALNTPLEITQKVGQTGLSSLSSADFQWIPALDEMDLDNPGYRARMKDIYDQFHQGQGSSANFENFYEAQILWDETMADAIASYVNAHPDQLFITLVGLGHVMTEDGIPNRVKRRIQWPGFREYSVELSTLYQ